MNAKKDIAMKPKIDPVALAHALGADSIAKASEFGGGVPGALAAADWGNHVRLWIKGMYLSIAGRIRFVHSGHVALDCVDGRLLLVPFGSIETIRNFGSPMGEPRSERKKR